ncbi:hypothetical protein RvY_18291 [Ramazzottius varieornatus]|uniref:Uncharacterized protein n=1 Tax=Ramazzottius varieornatus TaxID=947166 RepID=A0A1D1W5Q9_RAMVA|nr:hypothetical protein RvY_18291 [Ramazzottius varieornatus]
MLCRTRKTIAVPGRNARYLYRGCCLNRADDTQYCSGLWTANVFVTAADARAKSSGPDLMSWTCHKRRYNYPQDWT